MNYFFFLRNFILTKNVKQRDSENIFYRNVNNKKISV
jgi:hypothetical protein